jgi:hypothetical protein
LEFGIYKFDFFGTKINEISEIIKIFYELFTANKLILKKTFMTYMAKYLKLIIAIEIDF